MRRRNAQMVEVEVLKGEKRDGESRESKKKKKKKKERSRAGPRKIRETDSTPYTG